MTPKSATPLPEKKPKARENPFEAADGTPILAALVSTSLVTRTSHI